MPPKHRKTDVESDTPHFLSEKYKRILEQSNAHRRRPAGVRRESTELARKASSASAITDGGNHHRHSVSADAAPEKTGSQSKPVDRKVRSKSPPPNEPEVVKKPEAVAAEIKPYEPFPLGPHSSFNPANLTSTSKKSMNPRVLAKYQAYDKIAPELLERVAESQKRALVFLTTQRRDKQAEEREKLRRWKLIHEDQQPDSEYQQNGMIYAGKAKSRISDKMKLISNTWVHQLT
jgi:hypothetical protein